MKLHIGFIGLGLMGNPMAKNILKKGFTLTVYNRKIEKTKELVAVGAKVVNSPAELASTVDVVITMVTAAKDVESILFGDKGVVKGAKKGLTIIDMSTIGPTAAKRIAAKLLTHHIEFLDAPVTGSTPKATTGELTIFVGGKESVLEKVHPLLEAMGTSIVYLGATGSGQAIKLINNYLLASYATAFSESMVLADGMHLPREKVAQALLQTLNLPPSMHMKLPNYVHNDFPLAFSLTNMRKDVGLALIEMEQTNEYLPNLIQTERIFAKANEDPSLNQVDFTAILKQIEKNAKNKKQR